MVQRMLGPEARSALGRRRDLRHGDTGQPERALGAALHGSTAQAVTEVEGEVLAARHLDMIRAPAGQLSVEGGGLRAVARVKLQMCKWT